MEDLTELVKAAQAGDLRAYGKIVGRLQDLAYGAAFARLGDHHLSQDAAQDAFVEAFLHLPQLLEPAAFPGWFRQILFRQCIRLIRRKSPPLVPLEDALEIPSLEPGPAQAAEACELKDQVFAALGTLPEHERMATQLFYVGGYSHREISDFLGVPVTTVKKRLHSARARLKRKMLSLVQEQLSQQRPSRDPRFAAEAQLRAAAVKGEAGSGAGDSDPDANQRAARHSAAP